MVRLFLAGLLLALGLVNAVRAADGRTLDELRREAETGAVVAQAELGGHYLLGLGVERDPGKARDWYEKAADQGHALAQTVLGWLYLGGAGVKEDKTLAATWLRRAALQGRPEAQLSLGILYAEGEGVSQNFTEAHMWLSLAAAKLPQGSKLAEAAMWRRTVSDLMTKEQIDEAKRLADEFSAFLDGQ